MVGYDVEKLPGSTIAAETEVTEILGPWENEEVKNNLMPKINPLIGPK